MANWASTTSAMDMKLNALLLSQEEKKNIFNLSSAREIEKKQTKTIGEKALLVVHCHGLVARCPFAGLTACAFTQEQYPTRLTSHASF